MTWNKSDEMNKVGKWGGPTPSLIGCKLRRQQNAHFTVNVKQLGRAMQIFSPVPWKISDSALDDWSPVNPVPP